MLTLVKRIKMLLTLHKLEKIWYENNDVAYGTDAALFSSTLSRLKILKALEASQCVSLDRTDGSNRPVCIREGKKASIYTLERSEIWMNRIIGFIAGIATAVLTEFIIHCVT